MCCQQNQQQCQPPTKGPSKCSLKCPPKCPSQCTALCTVSSCCSSSSGGCCSSGGGSCCLSHYRCYRSHCHRPQSSNCCECELSQGSSCCHSSGSCWWFGSWGPLKYTWAKASICFSFFHSLILTSWGWSISKLTQAFPHVEHSAYLPFSLQK